MELADTILAAVSVFAALVTVWLAYLALSKASDTLDEAKQARRDAELAAKEAADERRAAADERHRAELDRQQAAADRRDEEYDRERRRLERVGEIVENIFWTTYAEAKNETVMDAGWMAQRNLLGHALVGLRDRLPETAKILNSATSGAAVGPASQARSEVERELSRITTEQQNQRGEHS